jgi:hypothetical protein
LWTTAASEIADSALELAFDTVGVGVGQGRALCGHTEENSAGASSADPSW